MATANVGGRTISAIADGGASINAHGDAATVHVGPHELVVERNRILVDGHERGTMSGAARNVRITLRGDDLTVTADGDEVVAGRVGR